MRNGFANHGSGCGDSRGSLHSSQRRGIETLPSIGSAENCATVHVNRLSSDSACQVGAEKQRRLRDLVRGLTSSLQNGTQKAGQLLLLAYVQLARELSTKLLAHASFSYRDRKSTRLNSSHLGISYAVFCLKKKKNDRKYGTYTENFCVK